MRSYLYNRISGIMAGNVPWTILSSGAVDNPGTPFMILSMGVEQPPLNSSPEERTQIIPFDVWVHDKPGTMVDNIDEGCRVLKAYLPTEDGVLVGNMSVYRIKWEETSNDLFDDQYGTNTRRISFSMMTRRSGQ